MAEIKFEANPNDAQEGFPLIPAGEYVAAITGSEVKNTKAGTGKYLNLKWTIIDGPEKNKTVFEILNLWNPNQQAVEISKRAMNAICAAVGISSVKDSNELHDKPMVIKIGIRKDGNGNDSNDVKKHSAYTGEIESGQSEQKPAMPWQQPK